MKRFISNSKKNYKKMEKYYKNEIKKLYDVFKDRWLQIPEYQRPYQWDSENITKLLDDIINPYFINLKKHAEENQILQIISHPFVAQ